MFVKNVNDWADFANLFGLSWLEMRSHSLDGSNLNYLGYHLILCAYWMWLACISLSLFKYNFFIIFTIVSDCNYVLLWTKL
jgi:hypothetical protein